MYIACDVAWRRCHFWFYLTCAATKSRDSTRSARPLNATTPPQQTSPLITPPLPRNPHRHLLLPAIPPPPLLDAPSQDDHVRPRPPIPSREGVERVLEPAGAARAAAGRGLAVEDDAFVGAQDGEEGGEGGEEGVGGEVEGPADKGALGGGRGTGGVREGGAERSRD